MFVSIPLKFWEKKLIIKEEALTNGIKVDIFKKNSLELLFNINIIIVKSIGFSTVWPTTSVADSINVKVPANLP